MVPERDDSLQDAQEVPSTPNTPEEENPIDTRIVEPAINDGDTTHMIPTPIRDERIEGAKGSTNEVEQVQQSNVDKHRLGTGSSVFERWMHLRLEIETDEGTVPLVVETSDEMTVGRTDPVTGLTPEIDLTRYAAYRNGVSRRHAILRQFDRQLQIIDLGSSNGTFLNGLRLSTQQPNRLRDGDEIRLGKLHFRVFFQSPGATKAEK